MKTRFSADTMLGRMAKWLRAMGYDAEHQALIQSEEIERTLKEGRILLSRRTKAASDFPEILLIRSDHVGEQLREVREAGYLLTGRSGWFSRCLVCNVPLITPDIAEAREHIPEYVYYEKASAVRYCPSCQRYFWPGSHRERMARQLTAWGF